MSRGKRVDVYSETLSLGAHRQYTSGVRAKSSDENGD